MNRYLDGWTIDFSIKFLFDIEQESLAELVSHDKQNKLELSACIPETSTIPVGELRCSTEHNEQIIQHASELREALMNHVELAIEWEDRHQQNRYVQTGFMDVEEYMCLPDLELTDIELYRFDPNVKLEGAKIKKRSLAIWLYKIGEHKLAEKVQPELNVSEIVKDAQELDKQTSAAAQAYFSSQTSNNIDLKTLFSDDDLPDLLYYAYDVFDRLWKQLPITMNKPPRAEIEKFIRQKGITEQSSVDAIIKISTPTGIKLGGKVKTDLQPWNNSYLKV